MSKKKQKSAKSNVVNIMNNNYFVNFTINAPEASVANEFKDTISINKYHFYVLNADDGAKYPKFLDNKLKSACV